MEQITQEMKDKALAKYPDAPMMSGIYAKRQGYIDALLDEVIKHQHISDSKDVEKAAREYANKNYDYDVEDSREGDPQAMRESIAHHNAIRVFKDAVAWRDKQHPVGEWSDAEVIKILLKCTNASKESLKEWLEEYKKTHTPVPDTRIEEFHKWMYEYCTMDKEMYDIIINKFNQLFAQK